MALTPSKERAKRALWMAKLQVRYGKDRSATAVAEVARYVLNPGDAVLARRMHRPTIHLSNHPYIQHTFSTVEIRSQRVNTERVQRLLRRAQAYEQNLEFRRAIDGQSAAEKRA